MAASQLHERFSSLSLTPLSTINLPEELLLQIFPFVPNFKPDPYKAISRSDYTHISQVCRQWRRLAQVCDTQLTIVPSHDKELASLALNESKPLPIAFHAFGPVDHSTSSFAAELPAALLASQELFRIYHLAIGNLQPELRESIDVHENICRAIENKFKHAPLLEAITIFGMMIGPKTFGFEPPPNLRRVSAFYGSISYQSSLFKASLTELALVGTEMELYGNTVPVHPLLSVLKRLPTLRSLALDDQLWTGGTRDASKHKPIRLPKLKHLRISGSPEVAADLLSWLGLPLSAQIDLRVIGSRQLALERVLPSLAWHHIRDRIKPKASFRRLRLAFTHRHSILTGWDPALSMESYITLVPMDLDTTSFPPCGPFMLTVRHNDQLNLSSLLNSIPRTSRLDTFEVTHPKLSLLANPRMWHELSQASGLCNIERIIVRGPAVGGLLAALDQERIFPQLRILKIVETDFTESGTGIRLQLPDIFRKGSLCVLVQQCKVNESQVRELLAQFKMGDTYFDWDGQVDGMYTESHMLEFYSEGREIDREDVAGVFRFPDEVFQS